MAIAIRARQRLTRRQLLVRSASTVALAGFGSLTSPYLSRAADRPRIAGGLASGDVSAGSAVVWARADRNARMQVTMVLEKIQMSPLVLLRIVCLALGSLLI